MKKWKLWVGLSIVLVAAGSGGAYYYLKPDKLAAAEEATSMTAQATRSNLELKISATGSVVANSRETVTSGITGAIEQLHFKVGDRVKAGQVLATFEPEKDYEKEISNLQTSIDSKQQQLEEYQTQYKEATGTENEEETKDKVSTSIESVKLEIAQLQEDMSDLYEEQQDVPQVVATVDGEVTESAVSVGDEVSPNTVIAEIVDYELLEFVVSVDELDIPSVKLGQTAQIHLNALTDRTFEGTVSEIAREGSSTGGVSAYEVRLLMKEIEGVLTGMSGEADIVLESRENVVVVPVDAVVEMGSRTFVRVPGGEEGEAAAGAAGVLTGRPNGSASGQSGGGTADGDAKIGTDAGAGGAAPNGGTAGGEGQPAQRPNAGDAGQGASEASGSAPQAGDATAQQGAGAGGRGQMPGFAQGEGAAPQGGGRGAGFGALAGMEGQLVPVEIGISNDTYVEIISGLEEGDEVLVPLPQGTVGMGSDAEDSVQMMPGMVMPGGGFQGGGGFAGGGGGGGFTRANGMGGAR
ncbi:efflux RND transporter periplasmic adaptor subunit [Paenibacillus soyae]|uniref:Efflux RND transporter periplasmic adaptor subunit n=1 Tax=Paenibacillus soyae TaxID=2969249 RepID=A0A9X2MUI8_9BACL|nr:efflux RND transporter periplasmic adaptor subunit [Paenibacillus soyae]MCR2806775.1 efflux RND transporter periplasmic adaptor subunit [Paenibacillus soyae]